MGELKKAVREAMVKKKFDLDSFGDLMDECILKSETGLLVHKEAGGNDWTVKGPGCGAVMDFYIFLNALRPIYLRMLEEMGRRMAAGRLAKELTNMMYEELIEAANGEE